ncbi:MAG: hypothetical protein ACRD0V_22390 [Acidimicrobiales bacterium]
MEWLTGLALLPALVCAAMMGGMALMGMFGLRRRQEGQAGSPEPKRQEPPKDREAALR